MSNYANLRNGIISVIRTNGNNEITGQLLQNELLAMITTLGYGYQFMGIATPTTAPGTPDAKVFYIAYTPGTYTNFGGIAVTGLCVLKYATSWIKEDIPVSGGGGGTDFTVEPTDLTLMSGDPQKLKFADRLRESNIVTGLNYIIVRDGVGISAQMTTQNAIYEIRYDFDLSNGTLNVPDNSILLFNGGKIKNGTVNGSKTVIFAPDCQIFESIAFSGSFIGALNACWVGAVPNDSSKDNSAILQNWFGGNTGGYADTFKVLSFPTGTYYFSSVATLLRDKRNLVLEGNNSSFSVNITTDDEYFIKLQATDDSSGEGFRIQNVRIVNGRKTGTTSISRNRAILFDRTQRFEVCNVQIWYFDIAIEIVDVWYGDFSGQNAFRFNRIGLLMHNNGSSIEVNTIEAHNVDFKGISREWVALIYPQQDGESDADYLTRTASCGIDAYCLLHGVGMRGCIFESFDYGIRTNWRRRSSKASQTGGPFSIIGCYFEDNNEEDIYVGLGNADFKGSGNSYYYFIHEMTISDCRFFTRKHVYLDGAKAFISSNQDFSLKIGDTSAVTTIVDFHGPVSIDGEIGASAIVHKIGGRPASIPKSDGTSTIPLTNFQKLQQTRYYGNIWSRLNGYSKTSTSSYNSNVSFKAWNFETEPKARFAFDILPLEYYRDNDNSFNRLLVPSGNGIIPVSGDVDFNFRALNCYGGISLYEFLRRWKAGTTYTGTVKNLFPFKVTADPTAGTVVNESGTLVGFGTNALGTTITTSYTTGYYLFVDALVWVRISYSRIKQYADHLQMGRTYGELRGSIDASSSVAAYLSCYGSNANMANVQKRLNAVYWDTTNSKLMIYNGFEWVEMTSAFQRYYYKEYGLKLAERSTMADLPGQTFINHATGIKYTFTFRANNSYKWVPSIGLVDSLTQPNGYADDNTLDYANELSVGEMVMYNGALYKWDGTQLVAV